MKRFIYSYNNSLNCLSALCFGKCFFKKNENLKWKTYTLKDVPGPYPFNYPNMKNINNICNKNTFILISIITACSQLEERIAIRKVYETVDSSIRFHFFIGYTSSSCQEEYEIEHSIYHDISQIPIQESFANETIFTLYLHRFLPVLCPYAKYYGKMDADQYINYSRLHMLLKRRKYDRNKIYVCRCFSNLQIITHQSYKYSSQVSIKKYYDNKLFKANVKYFTGSFALWPSYLSEFIYKESLNESNIIRMDDQHISWLIYRLNMKNNNISYFDLKCILSIDDLINNCKFDYENVYGIHKIKGSILYAFYELTKIKDVK